ncbi:MAG: histidine kinase, partial [Stenotrophomonas acidaminiphila]
LSTKNGHVDIRWTRETRDGGEGLVLRWEERGGPPVVAPTRRGFGSRLIERGLRHDLGGHVSLEFLPTGVVCEITAPLANEGAVA